MATRLNCLPWWHAKFEPFRQASQVYFPSGCPINSQGNVACDPEDMRAAAEAKLRAGGYLNELSLEAYTLARYMQGEVGDGLVEERVAVGEAAVNRAKLEKRPRGVLDILLYRQQPGHPNYGFYGPIHGPGGTTTAPYGRWATTHADPTLLTLLLADWVASGHSDNFSNGADDQDGIEYEANFPSIPSYVTKLANNGKFWVGPLPGVNHWRTFLQTTKRGETSQTAWGAKRVQETLAELAPVLALTDRSRREAVKAAGPKWDGLPICSRPGGFLIAGIAGTLIGAWAAGAGLLSKIGKPV